MPVHERLVNSKNQWLGSKLFRPWEFVVPLSGKEIVWPGIVLIQMEKVAPDKPMSLSTFNGDIDITWLAAIKATATVKMETQQGSIDSDFDLDKNPRQPTDEDGRKEGGKYRIVSIKASWAALTATELKSTSRRSTGASVSGKENAPMSQSPLEDC